MYQNDPQASGIGMVCIVCVCMLICDNLPIAIFSLYNMVMLDNMHVSVNYIRCTAPNSMDTIGYFRKCPPISPQFNQNGE